MRHYDRIRMATYIAIGVGLVIAAFGLYLILPTI